MVLWSPDSESSSASDSEFSRLFVEVRGDRENEERGERGGESRAEEGRSSYWFDMAVSVNGVLFRIKGKYVGKLSPG
jgi:hypothetical protein